MSSELPHILNDASASILPLELVQSLNQAYFLHLLVTEPSKVIPPGKSLLSMMQHANFQVPGEVKQDDKSKEILERVTNVAHKAFWDEALDALSAPLPSVQLPRLQRLYTDIHDVLSPLFPSAHPILVSLSSPVPPTSSPLHSTLYLLKDILDALLLRCAPIRDSEIQDILSSLSDPPFSYPLPSTDAIHVSLLAQFIIAKIKAIIHVAELMKTDLNSFVLGTMSEAQLKAVLFRAAKERERDSVVKLWGGNDVVRALWRSWLKSGNETSGDTETQNWVSRLIMAITSEQPVYSPIPQQDAGSGAPSLSSSSNLLPPQLFFFEQMLRSIQEYLQAVILMAALYILLPRSSSGATESNNEQQKAEFLQRVWILLKDEIDAQSSHNSSPSQSLKLVNLADEVIRTHGIVAGRDLTSEVVIQIRTSVERVLRSNDPAYLVLKRRLINVLETGLVDHDHEENLTGSTRARSAAEFGYRSPSKSLNVPAQMQAGRVHTGIRGSAVNATKKVRPETEGSGLHPSLEVEGLKTPLGFEDPLLRRLIVDLFKKLTTVVEWTESVWGDLV
ncbi:hypothetical protein CVT24_005130 [Panaeolus cyanescens]|uniref:Uncharacterized protein n=1 Tax=Panaeolus cyanescens TaxID=181874 RepID=A0A409V9P8_9AGAR|nr:hypothetical protein CVT24_005130 [Panaeolus cyanescens]